MECPHRVSAELLPVPLSPDEDSAARLGQQHWVTPAGTGPWSLEQGNIQHIYIYYISGHWGKGRGKKGQDERESSLVVGELLCCEVRHGAGGESESSLGWKWKSSLVVGKWFCCGNVGRGSERESSLVVGKWLCCGDMGFGVGGGSENHP